MSFLVTRHCVAGNDTRKLCECVTGRDEMSDFSAKSAAFLIAKESANAARDALEAARVNGTRRDYRAALTRLRGAVLLESNARAHMLKLG